MRKPTDGFSFNLGQRRSEAALCPRFTENGQFSSDLVVVVAIVGAIVKSCGSTPIRTHALGPFGGHQSGSHPAFRKTKADTPSATRQGSPGL